MRFIDNTKLVQVHSHTSKSHDWFGLYDNMESAIFGIIEYEKQNLAHQGLTERDYQIDINLQFTCAFVRFKTGKGEQFKWYTLYNTGVQTRN